VTTTEHLTHERSSSNYGWVIVAIGFLAMGLVIGSRFSLGLFMPYMPEALDASAAEVSGAIAISMVSSAVLQPLAGVLIDRLGGRVVLVTGLTFAGLGLCGTSFATAVWQVALLMGLVTSVGYAAVSPASVTSIVSSWFEKRRGVALGVATTGTKVALIVLPPAITAIIVFQGWRVALLAMGVAILLLVPAALLFVRPAPGSRAALRAQRRAADRGGARAEAPSLSEDGVDHVPPQTGTSLRRALGMPAFWMISLMLFANGFLMSLVMIHLPVFVLRQGYTEAIAATGLAIIGAIGIAGNLLTGAASDRLGRRAVLSIMFGARVVTMLGVVIFPGPAAFVAFIAVFGLLGYGAVGVIGAYGAELFGSRSMGAILGTAYVFNQLGGAAGTYAGGLSLEWTNSFDTALWGAIFVTVAAIGVVNLIGPRAETREVG